MKQIQLVFVHGYSVTNINTYGELPVRLRAEALRQGIDLIVEEIFLGRYISFDDVVRLDDISRAFHTAVNEVIPAGKRFMCITHSTGGPVIRNWWNKYYSISGQVCPMSHLIMLAPANYGSALAILGKGRLSRLVSWFNGVEPGQGVLDWLELGSPEAWSLNKEWITNGAPHIGTEGVFPFVITGQDIDRKLYDALNSYTGELGSDGVVRVAGANLKGRYIKLVQETPKKDAKGKYIAEEMQLADFFEAADTPLRVVRKKAHSGKDMGIMFSVAKEEGQDKSSETVKAIMDCMAINDIDAYKVLYQRFAEETIQVQAEEKLEVEDRILKDRYFIHDRYSMVIFKIVDTGGRAVNDFDLLLTAGVKDDPNHLPPGFFVDRQRNHLSTNVFTYYFNYDIMHGSDAVIDPETGKEVREKIPGAKMLGFDLKPRPDSGFVQYLPCSIKATQDMLEKTLLPNGTTMIEICLQRVVDKEVFRIEKLVGNDMPSTSAGNFKNAKPSGEIVD